jgi:DNA-binding NarL/FixJ family response regulator
MPISISIVEDDRQLRGSFAVLLNREADLCCVSAHSSAEEALLELPSINPDVVLMDVNLPGMNGVECVRQIKPQLSVTQIIMLSMFHNTANIFHAVIAGATGCLLKRIPPAELLDAIRTVHHGGSLMDSHTARKIMQLFQRPQVKPADEAERLSAREVQVLELLSKGYCYKEVAQQIELACSPVHIHIRNIYKKLQARSRSEAVTRHWGIHRLRQELATLRLW